MDAALPSNPISSVLTSSSAHAAFLPLPKPSPRRPTHGASPSPAATAAAASVPLASSTRRPSPSVVPSSSSARRSPSPLAPSSSSSSSAVHHRAATGYAAALADASIRAGTLLQAYRQCRRILDRLLGGPAAQAAVLVDADGLDSRVGALVRLFMRKGLTGMVGDVMEEFVKISEALIGVVPEARRGLDGVGLHVKPASGAPQGTMGLALDA